MENDERERSLKDIGERLQKIGQFLSETGRFQFGKSEIRPASPAIFIMRYERMPHGELMLKMELKWEDNASRSSHDDQDDEPDIGPLK